MGFFIDFNFKHFLFVCGCCYFAFSKNDLPYIAFGVGRMIGKTVGILKNGKDRISDFVSKQTIDNGNLSPDIKNVQNSREEIAKKISEFQQIRDELRTMSSMSTMGLFPTSFDGAVTSFVSNNIKKSPVDNTPQTIASAIGIPSSQDLQTNILKPLQNNPIDNLSAKTISDENIMNLSTRNINSSNDNVRLPIQQENIELLPSFIPQKNNQVPATNGSEALIESLEELKMINEFKKIQNSI